MDIQVKLRNVSPLFSAAPGASAIDISGKLMPSGQGFPYVRTRRTSLLAPDADMGTRWAEVPIIPSNTIRNLLRRIMLAEIVEPALIDNRHKLSIGAYATAYAGNQSGNPDGVASGFDEIAKMRNHPFIGLFGGGPRMLRGRLRVGHLYPIHQDALRIIGEEYQDEAAKGRLTDTVWKVRKDPIQRLTETEQTAVLQEGAEAANAWLQASLESALSKKDGGNADEASKDERGLNAMNAHEVVIPGVSWLCKVSMESPSDAQIGMVLSAIGRLGGNWTVAGGHAVGYGEVELESITLAGEVVWSGGQFNDSAMGYFDALAEATDNLGADEFEDFAASRKGK